MIVKRYVSPATGLEKVKVRLPAIVTSWFCDTFQSTATVAASVSVLGVSFDCMGAKGDGSKAPRQHQVPAGGERSGSGSGRLEQRQRAGIHQREVHELD